MNNSSVSIFLLGGTGSIGYFSLEALKITGSRLYGFSFYNNYPLALQIIKEYSVKVVFCPVSGMKAKLLSEFPHIRVLETREEFASFIENESQNFTVINGISGHEGIWYTHKVLSANRKLLLANKESIILGGQWILNTASPDQLIPIDSEHFSLFILLSFFPRTWVQSIGITASGGPFLNYPKEQFSKIRVQDALKHPVWDMGNNITLGSATLANKGLEILEAKELFQFSIEDITVRIHPQAQTHAMLLLKNGSWLSHQYFPSMEVPIAQAILFPDIPDCPTVSTPLTGEQTYTLPDFEKFPMLKLAYQVGKQDHTYQMVYTIANDIANELFLKERISFTQIPEFVKFNLDIVQTMTIHNVSDILSLKDELLSKILKNMEIFI